MTRRPPRSTRTGHLFPHTTLFRSDSLATVLALETGHGPVYYFPREDVRMDLLARTDHRTRCPYKGDASYWTLRAGDRRIENAVWSYERSEEHTSELQSLMRISYAVFCLKKKTKPEQNRMRTP